MRRLAIFGVAAALAGALTSTSVAAPNLAAYRCAGVGTLTAQFVAGPNPPSTSGYVWSLVAQGACAASPDGPWTFVATGRGHNGTCGTTPATTTSTLRPYEPFVVTFNLANPRTGATRQISTAWYFSATAGAYVISVRSATAVPSCSSPTIGGRSGSGVLVRGLDPTPVLDGSTTENYPAAFAVQFR